MELNQRLKRLFQHTRGFTDRVLDEINDPEDWVLRPAAGTNHALWIAGHLGYTMDFFIGLIDPAKRKPQENWGELFGKGSTVLDSLSDYPEPSEVRAYLSDRADVLLELLDQASDEELKREVPEGPAFMFDVGAIFQGAVWHEALHAGQLTVIHRMVGQTPIADRQ